MKHYKYGPIGYWEGGVNIAAYHLPYEPFPCTAEWFELQHELGERVNVYIENEYLGMGALFDLSYQLYVLEYETP